MLLVCPNCNKKYKMTAEQLGDVGRNVECSSCHHVWFSTATDLVSPQDLATKQPIAEPAPKSSSFTEVDAPIAGTRTSAAPQPTAHKPQQTQPASSSPKPTSQQATSQPTQSVKSPISQQQTETVEPVMPKVSPVALASAQPNTASKSSVTPITPKAPAPQVKPLTPQQKEALQHTASYKEDLQMFDEGADIFEKVEQGELSSQPTEKPKKQVHQTYTEKSSEAAQTQPAQSDLPPAEQPQNTSASIKKQESSAPEVSQVQSDSLMPQQMDEQVQKERPIPQTSNAQVKQPFFTPENSESKAATTASHTHQPFMNKAPEPPKFTEDSSLSQSEVKETIETSSRPSETIVQNLPVIVKQDVNNELKEALVRSQQLNSRLSFMVFANMLLLTGILILLLLKS